MVVEWPLREHGAERILLWLSQSRRLQFETCSKVIYRSKWAVSSKNIIIDHALQCEKVNNNKEKKMTNGDALSSYPMLFRATL